MPRSIAFLRAINVGGHTVRMNHLRERFESLGLSGVETFIASGNVIFQSAARNTHTLAKRIERHLHESLGYEVRTFLRTDAEVAAIATHRAFGEPALRTARRVYVGFLADALDAAAKKRVLALRGDVDDFHVNGREVYWLSRASMKESKVSYAVLEKAVGAQATLRALNTVQRLAAKYPPRQQSP